MAPSSAPSGGSRSKRMTDRNGSPERPGPIVPPVLLFGAIVVTTVLISGLLLVLFRKTEGPAPVLRDFAERVREGDCAGSYELLDSSVRDSVTEETWCGEIASVGGLLHPQFRVKEMQLLDRVAEITLEDGAPAPVWRLRKAGRSWRVLGPTEGFPLP
jgi:hypothetical protein